MGSGSASTKCTWREVVVFLVGLVSGTGCSLLSKVLLTAKSIGKTGEEELFEDPLFQSWVMFVAMTCALPFHFAFQWYQKRSETEEKRALSQGITATTELKHADMPVWTWFVLAIPACFDLGATVLCMFGLLYISASVYQLLRGACIVFVAIMKHFLLKDRLKGYNWLGVALLTIAITLVGLTSVLGAGEGEEEAADDGSQGARARAEGRGWVARRWLSVVDCLGAMHRRQEPYCRRPPHSSGCFRAELAVRL